MTASFKMNFSAAVLLRSAACFGAVVVATLLSVLSSVMSTPAVPIGARLIDREDYTYILLKNVIVLVKPGCGSDAVSQALSLLGFKVYDAVTAAANYTRDFPLWVEAAQSKSPEVPYGRNEFDKLIGPYNAFVGAPTSFFSLEVIKAYPYAKVIIIDTAPDPRALDRLIRYTRSILLARLDPTYFGKIYSFLSFACKARIPWDDIRSTIPASRLLTTSTMLDWSTLCTFLEVPVPVVAFPKPSNDLIQEALAARARAIITYICRNTFMALMYLTLTLGATIATYTAATTYLGLPLWTSLALASTVQMLVGLRCIWALAHILPAGPQMCTVPAPAPPAQSATPRASAGTASVPPHLRFRAPVQKPAKEVRIALRKPASRPSPRIPRPAQPLATNWSNFRADIAHDDQAKLQAGLRGKEVSSVNAATFILKGDQ